MAGLLLAACLLVAGAARAAAPTITDNAKLFSDRAVSEANEGLSRIYQHTNPHKQVDVETFATLPAGKQADTLAEERFRSQSLDGVLVLIVKDPHKLAVTVGRGTSARFHDADAVRGVMLDRFRRGDYDGGLLAGVRLLESRLTSEFAVGAQTSERAVPYAERTQRTERESSTSSPWMWLGILGGGALLAWFIWRLRKRNNESMNYGPPVGEYNRVYGAASPGPGYAAPTGGGGGGWGRAILGGAAGAVAGNWIYDRLFHGDRDGSAHAATSMHDDAPSPDYGDVGSTTGGHGDGADWSDGGGGGDFGGGGGGGDW